MPHLPTTSPLDTVPDSLIDPRLLLLDGHGAATEDPKEDTAAQRLDSLIYDNIEDLGSNEQAMGFDIFLENTSQNSKTSILTLPGREFVEALSKINIVRNTSLQSHVKTIQEHASIYCPIGNSRDFPTLFLYTCEKCKDYKTPTYNALRRHGITCKGEEGMANLEKTFICDRKGCEKAFVHDYSLESHKTGDHDWEPRKCNITGCTNERVFETRTALTNHLTQYYYPIEPPMRCSFPECTSTTLWGQMHNYREHLKSCHHLAYRTTQKLYLPEEFASRKITAADPFQPTSCPIGGTTACKPVYAHRGHLIRHLMSRFHVISLTDAQEVTRNLGKKFDQEEKSLVDREDSC